MFVCRFMRWAAVFFFLMLLLQIHCREMNVVYRIKWTWENPTFSDNKTMGIRRSIWGWGRCGGGFCHCCNGQMELWRRAAPPSGCWQQPSCLTLVSIQSTANDTPDIIPRWQAVLVFLSFFHSILFLNVSSVWTLVCQSCNDCFGNCFLFSLHLILQFSPCQPDLEVCVKLSFSISLALIFPPFS